MLTPGKAYRPTPAAPTHTLLQKVKGVPLREPWEQLRAAPLERGLRPATPGAHLCCGCRPLRMWPWPRPGCRRPQRRRGRRRWPRRGLGAWEPGHGWHWSPAPYIRRGEGGAAGQGRGPTGQAASSLGMSGGSALLAHPPNAAPAPNCSLPQEPVCPSGAHHTPLHLPLLPRPPPSPPPSGHHPLSSK